MADVKNFKPRLSSSRLFSKGSKDLDSGVVDDAVFNRMTSSFEEKKFLTDEVQFEYSAPLIYQLDLLKEDIDDIHSHLSESKYTSKVQKFPVVDVTEEFFVSGLTQLKGNTRIDGHTDIRGAFKINGTEVSDLKKSLDYARALEATGVTSTEFDKLDGLTSTATELNLLDGITHIKDEDNMSSNSATSLATQQSIKAYVDANAGGSSFTAAGISGSFTSLSASIATDINNAGGSTDLSAVNSHIIPDTDDTYSIGASNKQFKTLYIDGTANIDVLSADEFAKPPAPVVTTLTTLKSSLVPVSHLHTLVLNSSNALSITGLIAAHDGQEITIMNIGSGAVTITRSTKNQARTIYGSSNITINQHEAYKFVCNPNQVWYVLS